MEPENSSPVTYPDIFRLRDQIHKLIYYFSTRILNQLSNSLWITLCIYKILQNDTIFLSSTILNHSQSALHVTDNSRMKDVLQLTTATVMASSAKIKNMTPKVKTFRRWSIINNFTVETDQKAESLYENTRSVANILSEYTSSVG